MEKEIDEKLQGTSLVLEQKPENTKKLFIESYGCAMNFSDSEIVASIMTNEVITQQLYWKKPTWSWSIPAPSGIKQNKLSGNA